MSFGFGIGDFIAVGELCWKLYSQVYKVSRDAPEELRGLNQELGNLHNTIQLLIEELKDEDSVLIRSGDVRINTIRRVMSQSEETLKRMQQLSERYAELQTPSAGREKRRVLRIYWDQLKYSRELHTINDLRAKIMLQNSQLALILQGAQNSSLERIEKQNAQTDKKLDELRQLLMFDHASRDRPILTAPLDPNTLMELTNVFLQKAEFDNRPWASIGIDSWLQVGQWWLMKAQSQLVAAPPSHEDQTTYNQGYANLLKACWILTDIIAIHPQRTHMGSSNDRRAQSIQRLTQGAISKMKTLSVIVLELKDLLACNLDIWNLPPSTALTPSRRDTRHQPELKWQTYRGEIIFQKFAEYKDDTLELPIECIVIIEMPNEQSTDTLLLNLIVQNSMGHDIYKRQTTSSINNDLLQTKGFPIRFLTKQDERLSDCIIKSLNLLHDSLKPLPVDASMIYSAALLHKCCGAREYLAPTYHTSKPDTAVEDINILTRSRKELQITPTTSLSSSFQLIVDRIVEYTKQCYEDFPGKSDRMFWSQAHHCVWMLIYWVCDTFEEFLEFFQAIGIHSPKFHPVSGACLIKSSLLRKDTEFPQKFISFMNLKPDWTIGKIDLLLIALSRGDAAVFQAILKKTDENTLKSDWGYAWHPAFESFKWDIMGILLSAPGVNLYDLLGSLFALAHWHKWRELQIFADLLRSHGKYLVGLSGSDAPYRHTYESITDCCTKIIHKGGLHDLKIFIDCLQQLGISSYVSSTGELWTQSAILSALASRNLSILKLLSETGVVSISRKALDNHYYTFKAEQRSDYVLRVPEWPLDLAIAFVLDLETVEYLCRAGARLGKWNGTDFDEPELIRELRLTTSVSDARTKSCYRKATLYESCFWGRDGVRYLENHNGKIKYQSFFDDWHTAWNIIFENDCRHLYDVADVSPGLTWRGVQDVLYRNGPKDIPITASWPAPLSTQELWDCWRSAVIDLLERTHQGKYDIGSE